MGIASLILGIISFLISFSFFKDLSLILAIVGLVLGIISLVKKKNKGLCITGIILTVLSLVILFTVDDNITSVSSTKNDDNSSILDNIQEVKTYSLNDIVTIKNNSGNEYSMQITSIKEMKERNQFSDINPAQVFLIEYTYKNIKGEDLYISEMNFQIIDEQGEMGDSYPNNITNYPQATPEGATCKAQMILYVNNKSNTITLNYKDNMFNSKTNAKFKIDI